MSLSSKTEEAPVDTTKSESSESTAWQQHLDKNPNLKAWVEANPTLGEEKRKNGFPKMKPQKLRENVLRLAIFHRPIINVHLSLLQTT